jgi:hypothetical protein
MDMGSKILSKQIMKCEHNLRILACSPETDLRLLWKEGKFSYWEIRH